MAVSLQIGVMARELIWKQLPPGGGFPPGEIWLDSGLPPQAVKASAAELS